MNFVGEPYEEEQLDEDNKLRNVLVFPLMRADGKKPVRLPKSFLDAKEKEREKLASKLNQEELELRARLASGKGATRKVITNSHERNPCGTEYAKKWAKGICQLCESPVPFRNSKREPHLHSTTLNGYQEGENRPLPKLS